MNDIMILVFGFGGVVCGVLLGFAVILCNDWFGRRKVQPQQASRVLYTSGGYEPGEIGRITYCHFLEDGLPRGLYSVTHCKKAPSPGGLLYAAYWGELLLPLDLGDYPGDTAWLITDLLNQLRRGNKQAFVAQLQACPEWLSSHKNVYRWADMEPPPRASSQHVATTFLSTVASAYPAAYIASAVHPLLRHGN